jgi:hypothetical protein
MVFERKIRERFAAGGLTLDDIVIFSADRSEAGAWAAGMQVNVMPTLTCQNRYLFIADVRGVVEELPDKDRDFFRLVLYPERLALQGFAPELALDLSRASTMLAAGNAYPVPFMIAILHPMIKAMTSAQNSSFADWPPPGLRSPELPSELKDFQKALKSKPMLLAKRPGAKLLARPRPRCKAEDKAGFSCKNRVRTWSRPASLSASQPGQLTQRANPASPPANPASLPAQPSHPKLLQVADRRIKRKRKAARNCEL